jgi:hypothetical protein
MFEDDHVKLLKCSQTSALPELRTLIYRHKYSQRAKNADKNRKVAKIDAFSDLKKDVYCQQSKGEGDDDR